MLNKKTGLRPVFLCALRTLHPGEIRHDLPHQVEELTQACRVIARPGINQMNRQRGGSPLREQLNQPSGAISSTTVQLDTIATPSPASAVLRAT